MFNKILISTLLLLSFSFLGAAAPGADMATWHVSVTGSNSNPGTAEAPFRTIQRGVDVARPGDRILVHAGTYHEMVMIAHSGQPERRIRMLAAGDGPVIVTKRLAPVSCDSSAPTRDRTFQFLWGVDHWTVRGLTIVGGVFISGTNVHLLKDDLLRDRSLPGRGTYDPEAAKTTLPLLGVDPADDIRLLGNRIVGRGVYAMGARYGRLNGNEISQIECGSGSAVVLSRFSDFWRIRNNHIHDVPASPHHFMSEGIRVASASMYNLVENNVVEDLGGFGRGITADVNAGWNLYRWNVVRRALQGFNEQTGSWGNQWLNNLAESNRQYGFNIDGKDSGLGVPDDGVPAYLYFRCNASRDTAQDLNIGSVQVSAFETNAFRTVKLSKSVRGYWRQAKNTWNGSSEPPAENQPAATDNGCRPGPNAGVTVTEAD